MEVIVKGILLVVQTKYQEQDIMVGLQTANATLLILFRHESLGLQAYKLRPTQGV